MGRHERSHSTAQSTTTRFSLGNIYNNRRSMPNAPRNGNSGLGVAGAASPTWSTDDADVEVDMGGLDMFNRQSIAMFERYNKEQVRFISLQHKEHMTGRLLFVPHFMSI